MYDVIKKYRKNIISIMTDGIILDKKPTVKTGKALGDWDVEVDGEECVVVRTGVYQFRGQKPKRRGYLQLKNIFETLAGKQGEVIKLNYQRPRHFKEMLIQKTPQQIGVFLPDVRKIHINIDQKRIWENRPNNAHELLSNSYTSIAVPISMM